MSEAHVMTELERMLVVVFDSEARADDASRALLAMDEEGLIAVRASRLVVKDPVGEVTVVTTHQALPGPTWAVR